MTITEIVPGLALVHAENNGRFPFAHSFLIQGTSNVLIDTGCGERVLDELTSQYAIDIVLSSHSHPDHTALNWKFNQTPIYAPQYSADTFGNIAVLGDRFTEPGKLAVEWRGYVSAAMHFKTALPTNTFSDGDVFDYGTIRLVAIHTPGHTIDHTCFFMPMHGILLSFDIDLTAFGPWYGHVESDINAFEESIRKIIALKPKIIVSSHKGIITDDITSHLQRYLGVIEARERLLIDLLPNVNTLDELTDLSPFYQGYPYAANLLRYWEGQMIRKHLVRMVKRGELSKRWIDPQCH